MKRIIILALFFPACVRAQDSTGKVSISSYAEIFYTYDFNKPSDNKLPGFIYSHNRNNEFTINLAYIKAAYSAERIRANITMATGTYINANYAAEPGVLKNIYEANAGIKISKTQNLWLDAGIMPSHIGFENAVSKDCYTVTRSIMADNSPYYEAGVKLTRTADNTKWVISAMLLNGWQRIKRVDGSSAVNWGTQVQYKPSPAILLNYSTFIGTDKPDSTRQRRIFHNFYAVTNIKNKLGITAGFDAGTEQQTKDSKEHNVWYAAVLVARFTFSQKWALAARAEHYCDKNGVIIATGTSNGFNTSGFSVNLDHSPFKNVLVRIETRTLSSRDRIFIQPTGSTKSNYFITGSLAAGF